MGTPNTQAFWEDHYTAAKRVWSGHVNLTLSSLVGKLPPGRALDLGCGEGADALWLARRGWEATGIDISATAIHRAEAHAREDAQSHPTAGSAHFLVGVLPQDLPPGPFDLVSACFLQSPVALDRLAILHAAARQVAVGGHLLILSHAAPPPWAQHGHEHPDMPTVAGDLQALDPLTEWELQVAEIRQRPTVAPDGQPATLEDTVVFAQRLRLS